jgi:hypothetical protein
MLKFLERIKTGTWLASAAGLASLERLLLYIFYRPVTYNDTASYRRLAEAVAGGWGLYDGTRTPGYPVFLAVFGPDERVYAAQLAFGLLTTLLFFYIGWRVTGKGWVGALAALMHSLNLQQLFFEADLITESITTFTIALSLAGVAWLFFSEGRRPLVQTLAVALVIGLAGGAAALTRPLFIFLPFWAGFFLLVFWRARPAVRWGTALAAGLSALVLIAVWVNFIHKNYHRWALETMTGYHLVQHTGAFFEYVPDQYAAIRDTFIKFRDARIAATGSPANAIWDAIPALQQVSGIGFYDLSDLLTKISIQLILQHPFLYLRSAAQGWLWFWKVPVYWAPEQIMGLVMQRIWSGLVLAERGGIFVCNLIFLAGSVALLWNRARRMLKPGLFVYFSFSFLWLTTIAQALLDHGDNPRFSVPVQTLVVLAAMWTVIQWVNNWPKRKVTND